MEARRTRRGRRTAIGPLVRWVVRSIGKTRKIAAGARQSDRPRKFREETPHEGSGERQDTPSQDSPEGCRGSARGETEAGGLLTGSMENGDARPGPGAMFWAYGGTATAYCVGGSHDMVALPARVNRGHHGWWPPVIGE